MANKRPRPTAADYLVIGVSPALIMVMLGSLLWFITAAVYQGNFPERTDFCIAMFALGAVCVARISIEEGYEYAAIYGVPLAGLLLLAMRTYVPLNIWLSAAMLALVWWLADRLTWDCTFIDERQMDGGQGLLQTIGLEGTADASAVNDLSGTTARDKPESWFARWTNGRKRPHSHGVWVVYFSLAALPIFAIGQIGLLEVNLAARQQVLTYATVYLAAALGLLLLTSFLGMRRYLRQRFLPMPASMAVAWSVTGGLLILGVLVVTLFIPRTNAEFAVSKLPSRSRGSEPAASKHAFSREGTKDKTEQRSAASQNDPADKPDEGQRGGTQRDSTTTKSGEQGNGGNTSGNSETKDQQSGTEADHGDNASGQPAGDASPPPPAEMPPPLELPFGVPLALVQYIVYALLVLTAIYFLWLGRDKIAAALTRWLQKWREFWAALFGYRLSAGPSSDARAHRPPQPFAAFANPFQNGQANLMTMKELVEYTFAAMEAWALEFSVPRSLDQTPSEFAKQLAAGAPALQDEAWLLAEIYNFAAYAPQNLGPQVRSRMETIWRGLQRAAPPPPPPTF